MRSTPRKLNEPKVAIVLAGRATGWRHAGAGENGCSFEPNSASEPIRCERSRPQKITFLGGRPTGLAGSIPDRIVTFLAGAGC